jgi:hypothetical protein
VRGADTSGVRSAHTLCAQLSLYQWFSSENQ